MQLHMRIYAAVYADHQVSSLQQAMRIVPNVGPIVECEL